MTQTPVNLFVAQYAPSSNTNMYVSPTSTTTIIDKFTANNTSGSGVALSVYIVPNGGTAGASNLVYISTIGANTFLDITGLQDQILAPGDSIYVLAGTGSAIVVRGSGRQGK